MQARWIGYAYGEIDFNPDGTIIHDGLDLYQISNGKRCDAYWLIEQLQLHGGLGDVVTIPQEVIKKFGWE